MTIAKALVVDDSKVAHLTLRKMLVERSIEVDWVGSGEESIEYLKHQTPDVVFMDIMMPGMDGFETLQAISEDPTITKPRVVMCSANATSEDRSLADQHGAEAFLSKPYTTQELDKLLEALSTSEPVVSPMKTAEVPVEPATPAFPDDRDQDRTEQIRIPEPEPLTLPTEPEPIPAPTPTTSPSPAPDRAALEAMMHEIAESATRKNAEITLHAARQASTRAAENAARRVVEEMLQQQQPPDAGIDPEQLRQSLQHSLAQQLQSQLQAQIQTAVAEAVHKEIANALVSEDFGQQLDQRIEATAVRVTEGPSRDIAQRVTRDMLAEQQMDDTADKALGKSGSALALGGLALVLALAALAVAGGNFLGFL